MSPTVTLPVCIIALVMFSKSNLPTLLEWCSGDKYVLDALDGMGFAEAYWVAQLQDDDFRVLRDGPNAWRIVFEDRRQHLNVTVFISLDKNSNGLGVKLLEVTAVNYINRKA